MDLSPRPKSLLLAAKLAAKEYAIGAAVGVLALCFLPGWLRCMGLIIVVFLCVSSIITPFIIDWKPRERVHSDGKSVVITGCDSGFGKMLAQRLDDLGYEVFAGCLFPTKVGAEELKRSGSERLHVVQLDVTDDTSVRNFAHYVQQVHQFNKNKLWSVVCNAGINDGAEIHWTDVDVMRRVVDVNTFGVVRVTKAFLTELCHAKGRVVTVASAAGRYTYTGMVPYCMSKQAAVSFCEGLRLEMYKFGVKVITVEPWMYRTAIASRDNIDTSVTETWNAAPDEVKFLYPANYLPAYLKKVHTVLEMATRDDPSEVIACLEEAVSAKTPKYCYQPGVWYLKLAFWWYRKLPRSLSDFITYREMKFASK